MTCPCDDIKRKMPKCDAGTPPVLEINGGECPVLFHTVNIPASVGNATTIPPTPGAYRNARVTYEADDLSYLYDSDGIPQLLSGGGEGGKVSSVNGKIGEVVLDATDVGAASKTEFDDFVDTVNNELDRTVIYDLEMSSDANSVTFKEDKIDVVTGVTSQETDIIPTASSTTAGTISAAEYLSIKNSQDRLNALEGGSVAVSGLSASPSQQDLTDAWLLETGETQLINRAAIYDIDNSKIWTYYVNTTTWYETSAGGVSIGAFTNSVAGTILGSSTDGNVSANLDGTGTVAGWSDLVTTVSGKADSSSLATVATSGLYSDLSGTPTIPTVDSTLDTTSTNAIENQAVANEFEDVAYIDGAFTLPSSVALVSNANLQNNSVTTSKIADGAVTSDKIDSATLYPLIQSGTEIITNAGWVSVTFDHAFSSTPHVIATLNTQNAETSTATWCKVANVSTTGFRTAVGTANGYGTGQVDWIATIL